MQKEKINEALLTMVIGFMVLHLIFKLPFLLYLSLGIGMSGLLSNFLGRKIVWLWFKIASILGYINGKVLLSIVFFVFLTPIAFLNKLFSKNLLQIKKEKQAKSMYIVNHKTFQKEDLENIF